MGNADNIRWSYVDVIVDGNGAIHFNKVPVKPSQSTLYLPTASDIYCSEYLHDDLLAYLKAEKNWCNSNNLGLKHQSVLWYIESLNMLAYNYISVASAGSNGIANTAYPYIVNIDTAYGTGGNLASYYAGYISKDCVTLGDKHCSSFYLKLLIPTLSQQSPNLFYITASSGELIYFYDKPLLDEFSPNGYYDGGYRQELQSHSYPKSYTLIHTPDVSPIFSIEDTSVTYDKKKLIPVNTKGKSLQQQPPFIHSKIAPTGEVIATMDICAPLSMATTPLPQTYLIYRRDMARDRHAVVSNTSSPHTIAQVTGNDGSVSNYLYLGMSYQTTYTDRIPSFSESSSGPTSMSINDSRIYTSGMDTSVGTYSHALRFFSDVFTERYLDNSSNTDIFITIYYQAISQFNIFINSTGIGISQVLTSTNAYNGGYNKYVSQISMSTGTSNPLAIATTESIGVIFFRRSMHGRKLYRRGSTTEYITIIRSGSGVYAYRKTNITTPLVAGDIFELRDTDVKEYMCSKGSKTAVATDGCVGCEIPNYRHVYIVSSLTGDSATSISDLIPSMDGQNFVANGIVYQSSPELCLNKMIDAKAINALGYIVAISDNNSRQTVAQVSTPNTSGVSEIIRVSGYVDGVPRLSPNFPPSINYMSSGNQSVVVTIDTNTLPDQNDGLYSDTTANVVYISPII